MAYDQSRHLLPVNSVLFNSTPNLRPPLPTAPTLVNLHDAANTEVSALPMQAVNVPKVRKPNRWQRAIAKIKQVFTFKKKLKIGKPTDFQHHSTGAFDPTLCAPVTADGQGEGQ